MARFDQFIGLPNTEVVENAELIGKKSKYRAEFAFDVPNTQTLGLYKLQDGTIAHEFVQYNPWSSGPMFFTALCDESGNLVEGAYWKRKHPKDAQVCGMEFDEHKAEIYFY